MLVKPAVLSYGMGFDSTRIIYEFHRNPQLLEKLFGGWKNLTVLTAQTGNEYRKTKELVEQYVYPILREHRVKTAQVARAGLLKEDGYILLDETDQPTTCHLTGAYTLAMELLQAGTVPQKGSGSASGRRSCTHKSKGLPLDWYFENFVQTDDIYQIIGYNADELHRVKRCDYVQKPGREFWYPLVEWRWGRRRIERSLNRIVGEKWMRSACVFCPFSEISGKRDHEVANRFRLYPDEAGLALFIEFVALSLNPRQGLYGSRTAYSLCEKHKIMEAIADFEKRITQYPWTVYEVRRIYPVSGREQRSIRIAKGASPDMSMSDARKYLETMYLRSPDGVRFVEERMNRRLWIEGGYEKAIRPYSQHLFVAAPAVVKSKQVSTFERNWDMMHGQLSLFSKYFVRGDGD